MPPEKFEGFFVPKEKSVLTPEQINQVKNLKKVECINRGFQEFIGETNLLARPDTAPTAMTSPSALLKFVKETAINNNVSPWEVVEQIRTAGVEDPEKLAALQKKYKEKITYVSDIHVPDDDLLKRLSEIADNPPSYLIFQGDMTGAKKLENFQTLFYNYLNSHSRNELLKQNPQATDAEILAYSGTNPPEKEFNLKKGFIKLKSFELKLEEKSDKEIESLLSSLSDHEIAEEIRKDAKYIHFGHYLANLPKAAKANLASNLQENAQKLVDSLSLLASKGIKIFVLEGNWDARGPLDFKPGEPTAVPVPPEQKFFNVSKRYQESGINFLTKAETLETKTTLHVLLPFYSLTSFNGLPKEEKDKIRQTVKEARQKNKTIIVVAHGEPNWQIHNMTVKDAKPAGEHAQVIHGFEEALCIILPDEIIYGHMHLPLADDQRKEQDINTKYALQIKNGKPELIDDPSKFDPSSMVASYMQLRRIAEVNVPIHGNRKISGFGGGRQQAKVS